MTDTTATQVDTIVKSAADAAPSWAHTSRPDRAAALRGVADKLDAAGDQLVPLAMQESHLPEARLRGELARTTFQLRLLGETIEDGEYLDARIDHADADWPMGARPDLRRTRVPVGPTVVFAASNFPFAFSVIGGDSASALAAGCSVVHKGHEAHPKLAAATADVVIEALTDAGAPAGLFSLITGLDAAQELVEHPLVQAVGFTGSVRAGRAIHDRIAARPNPVPFYGELGSTNPVFVAPDAWHQRAAQIIEGYVNSSCMGVGQFCTKPGLLVVPSGGDLPKLLTDAGVGRQLGRMLTDRLQGNFTESLIELRERQGIATLTGGSGADELTVLSTTAENVLADPEILQTEVFGPATLIIEYTRDDAVIDLAEAAEGQLTATVHAEDSDDVDALVEVLGRKAGRLLWNGWPTGVTVSYAQQHGGPYPATTAPNSTSVGTAAIRRFLRPVAYQDFPAARLPEALRDDAPAGLRRRIDGVWTG